MTNSFYNGNHRIYRDENGMCNVFKSTSDKELDFETSQTIILFFSSLYKTALPAHNPYELFNDVNAVTKLISIIGRNKNIELHGINNLNYSTNIVSLIQQLRKLNCYVVVTSRNKQVLEFYNNHVDATYYYDNLFIENNFNRSYMTGYCVDKINSKVLESKVNCYGLIDMMDELSVDEVLNLPEHIICFEISKTKGQIPSIIFDMQEYATLNTIKRENYIEKFKTRHFDPNNPKNYGDADAIYSDS